MEHTIFRELYGLTVQVYCPDNLLSVSGRTPDMEPEKIVAVVKF